MVRVITVYVILFHWKPGLLNKRTSDGVDERELLALIRYAPCSDIDKLYSYAALSFSGKTLVKFKCVLLSLVIYDKIKCIFLISLFISASIDYSNALPLNPLVLVAVKGNPKVCLC